MQIGDYVRLVHGIEEGYIVKVVDDHNLEIETLDGFVIPVLKKGCCSS